MSCTNVSLADFDSELLDNVCALSNPGSIDQSYRPLPCIANGFNRITSSSGNLGNDFSSFSEQCVEQGRFPDIWLACDDHDRAFPNYLTNGNRREKQIERRKECSSRVEYALA